MIVVDRSSSGSSSSRCGISSSRSSGSHKSNGSSESNGNRSSSRSSGSVAVVAGVVILEE